MKHALTLLLCLAIAQCGLSPAWAATVTLPESPPPAVEPGGPDAADLAASASIGTDLAMLYYHVPADGKDLSVAPASPIPAPIRIQAGSDAETRIDVNLSAADRASEGWPWYGKAAVIAGCVLLAGLATWAIIEASSDSGIPAHDSSQHMDIRVNDGGNVAVHYHSPESHGGPGPGGQR